MHIIWQDDYDGNKEIYYIKLNQQGVNLTEPKRLTYNAYTSENPSISSEKNGNIHITWNDFKNGSREIYYMKLNNLGVNITEDVQLTFGSTYSCCPSIAINNCNVVNIVWEDHRHQANDNNWEIYYKRTIPTISILLNRKSIQSCRVYR